MPRPIERSLFRLEISNRKPWNVGFMKGDGKEHEALFHPKGYRCGETGTGVNGLLVEQKTPEIQRKSALFGRRKKSIVATQAEIVLKHDGTALLIIH